MKQGITIILLTFIGSVVFGQKDLSKFGIADDEAPKGLEVGARLPNGEGIGAEGELMKLSSIKQEGALIVIFFRGEWCPYCTQHLAAVSDSIAMLQKAGATVVAITPEMKREGDEMGSDIIFLYDKENKLMEAFDVDFQVTKAYQDKVMNYKSFDLADHNGQEKAVLPIPGTFVFDANGKLVGKHIDVNYTERSTVAWMLEQLN